MTYWNMTAPHHIPIKDPSAIISAAHLWDPQNLRRIPWMLTVPWPLLAFGPSRAVRRCQKPFFPWLIGSLSWDIMGSPHWNIAIENGPQLFEFIMGYQYLLYKVSPESLSCSLCAAICWRVYTVYPILRQTTTSAYPYWTFDKGKMNQLSNCWTGETW